MDNKSSVPTSSWKLTTAPPDAATKAAHAPIAGKDSDGVEMKLPDTMTKVPKLPHIDGMGHDIAHSHNSAMSAKHFGTETEKAKVKSDAGSNYPGCGDDCPSY